MERAASKRLSTKELNVKIHLRQIRQGPVFKATTEIKMYIANLAM
jgi:hypothetical protein